MIIYRGTQKSILQLQVQNVIMGRSFFEPNIEKFIETLGERFNIREIAFDRWGAVQMVQNLEGMGFTVVPFGQGFKDMSLSTKELMKLTLEKKLATWRTSSSSLDDG